MIDNLQQYHLAWKEWNSLYEMNLGISLTKEVQDRMCYLTSIMEEYAYEHVQEIWPTMSKETE